MAGRPQSVTTYLYGNDRIVQFIPKALSWIVARGQKTFLRLTKGTLRDTKLVDGIVPTCTS